MDKKIVAIIGGSVILLGVMIYLLWGFFLGFLLLSVVYAFIGIALIYRFTDDPDKNLRDNNTPFWIGLCAVGITFLIACFNFGPALLLPENLPTPEQRSTVSNFVAHMVHGKNAVDQAPLPAKPLPWATGTWFWWKATFLFFWLTFAYAFIAFWDEAVEAFKKHKERKEREARNEAAHPPAPHATPHATTTASDPGEKRPGFGGRLVVEFLAELMAEFVVKWVSHRRP